MDKNVPEIRFKGFSESLDNLVLGENSQLTKGQGFSKGDLVNTGTPIILYGRLYTKYQTVISNVDTFVNEEPKSLKSIGGEVIIPASGESPEDIARAAVVSESGVILGGDLNVIYPNKRIDPIYLALALSHGRLKKEISSKAQGKSVVHIKNSDLEGLELLSPKKAEQTQIGNYFQKIDSLINQHQKKHDKLSNIKKAMLEKMLPQSDETIPEIRFEGFSEDWEESTLLDCTDLLTGNPFNSKEFKKDGIFLVRGMNVKRKYLDTSSSTSEYWYSSKGLERYLLEPEDIVIQMDGALIGKSYAKITGKHLPALLVQRVTRVRCIDVVPEFIYQYIQKNFLMHISSIKTETAVPHLSLNDIRNFSVLLPHKNEQQKIGKYFQKLDELISQHQQQITKLNNIKQACLNKMFV
jgi:type I restriction enzyme S subunit